MVTCPLVPGVPHLRSGSCSLPCIFGLDFLQTSPRGDALALLLTLGSANTWCEDLHLASSVPCPAHTPTLTVAVQPRPRDCTAYVSKVLLALVLASFQFTLLLPSATELHDIHVIDDERAEIPVVNNLIDDVSSLIAQGSSRLRRKSLAQLCLFKL